MSIRQGQVKFFYAKNFILEILKIIHFKNLRITEEDTGDGWTKVKILETGAEGFVPTSYIAARP